MLECTKCALKAEIGKNFCRKCGSVLIDPAECLTSAAAAAESGEYSKGIEYLEKISHMSLYSRKKYLLLVRLLISSNQPDDAHAILTDLVDEREFLNEEEKAELFNLLVKCANAYSDSALYRKSLRCYEMGSTLGEDGSHELPRQIIAVSVKLIESLINEKDLAEARVVLDSLSVDMGTGELARGIAEAHASLGQAELERGAAGKALPLLSKAKELEPDNEAYNDLVSCAQHAIKKARGRRRTLVALIIASSAVLIAFSVFLYYYRTGFIEVQTDTFSDITISKVKNNYNSGAIIGKKDKARWIKTDRIGGGKYFVEVIKDGYATVREKVTVGKNRTTILNLQLQPQYGSLNISSHPLGASVSVDGKVRGITPLRVDTLLSVPHQLIIRRAYFRPETLQIDVRFEEVGAVDVTLKQYEGYWEGTLSGLYDGDYTAEHSFNARLKVHIISREGGLFADAIIDDEDEGLGSVWGRIDQMPNSNRCKFNEKNELVLSVHQRHYRRAPDMYWFKGKILEDGNQIAGTFYKRRNPEGYTMGRGRFNISRKDHM